MTAVKEEPTLIKSQASRRRGHWREPNFPMSFLENKESCPCLQMDPLDVVSLWHVFDPSPLSNLSLRDLMDSACPQRAPRGHFSWGGVVRGGYFASVLVCFPENPGTSGKLGEKGWGTGRGTGHPPENCGTHLDHQMTKNSAFGFVRRTARGCSKRLEIGRRGGWTESLLTFANEVVCSVHCFEQTLVDCFLQGSSGSMSFIFWRLQQMGWSGRVERSGGFFELGCALPASIRGLQASDSPQNPKHLPVNEPGLIHPVDGCEIHFAPL